MHLDGDRLLGVHRVEGVGPEQLGDLVVAQLSVHATSTPCCGRTCATGAVRF